MDRKDIANQEGITTSTTKLSILRIRWGRKLIRGDAHAKRLDVR